jgi:hypothetical protein
MERLDIVDLIEKNPITKLSSTYQGTLLTKIKTEFTDEQQQLFVASFYCYLNYDTRTEFVIDLDDVWRWLGFNQKVKARMLLEKNFRANIDYKYLLSLQGKQRNGRGGHNKETILLTVRAFKLLCLKADTKKADQIHEYYIKLEETLQDVINEESNELRLQLDEKNKQLENILTINEKEKDVLREKTILEQFTENVQCIYYGLIDNVSNDNESLIKFGCSNNLSDRVSRHKKTFIHFRLNNAFKVENKTHIENAIKRHPILSKLKRTLTIKNNRYTELLAVNEISFDAIDTHIKEIIKDIEYNPENYAKLLHERELLENKCMALFEEVEALKSNIHTTDNSSNSRILVLTEENEKLKKDNIKLMKQYKLDKNIIYEHDEPSSSERIINNIEYSAITSSLKRLTKSSDGLFHIDGFKYSQCFGTRDEVWKRTAYKTAGGLTIQDLMINKHGKIVSRKKFIAEKDGNRLSEVNERKRKEK